MWVCCVSVELEARQTGETRSGWRKDIPSPDTSSSRQARRRWGLLRIPEGLCVDSFQEVGIDPPYWLDGKDGQSL